VSHGPEAEAREPGFEPHRSGVLAAAAQFLAWINNKVFGLSMLALLAAALILTGSVFLRYFLKVPTDWQDEASVFLMVGAVFMSGAYVQLHRGHVGIEALASLLPPRVNWVRHLACDMISFLFCGFFAWKSWTLLREAWMEGQTTSSAWAPPLSIPYGLMAVGMTLLALQILLQVASRLAEPSAPPARK
jgi:TRAP-type C4-dicarboxylate transport system permease small subunit